MKYRFKISALLVVFALSFISGCERKTSITNEVVVIDAQTITPIQEPSIPTNKLSVEPNSDLAWQVYRNSEWGISFKYPGDWEVVDVGQMKGGFVVRPSSYQVVDSDGTTLDGPVYFRMMDNPDNLSIIDSFDRSSDTSRFWPQKFEYKHQLIDGHKAVYFPLVDDGYFHSVVEVALPGNIFYIAYVYTDASIYQSIFDTIIASIEIE